MIQPERQPTRLAPGEIDPVQPIDPTSPLARGLEGLWLPLPHLTGGSRLYDLSGRGRHGDLTNMDPTTDWLADPEVASPALLQDSGTEHIDVPSLPPASEGFTVAFYARTRAVSEQPDGNPVWLEYHSGSGAGRLRFYATSGSVGSGNNEMRVWGDNTGQIVEGGRVDDNDVHLGLLSWEDDGAARLYLDGREVATGSGTGVVGDSVLTFGYATATDSGGWIGDLFAVSIWLRALSETEQRTFYSQAGRGFPDLLRRRDETSLYVSTAGAVTAQQDETAELVLNAFSAEAQNQTPQAAQQDDLASINILGTTTTGANQSPQTASQDTPGTLDLRGFTSNANLAGLLAHQGSIATLSLGALTAAAQTQSPQTVAQDAPGIITLDGLTSSGQRQSPQQVIQDAVAILQMRGLTAEAQRQSPQLVTQDEVALLLLQAFASEADLNLEEVTEAAVHADLKRTVSVHADLQIT